MPEVVRSAKPRTPSVTVIVPAYNHERYVLEALDSIRAEGYPNVEIAIIDDGSTDATWDRIEHWRLEHRQAISVLAKRQDNIGLTRTLNRLLDLANGDYVAMLASDDRLVQGGLAARVDVLERHPGLAAVFGDCNVIDAMGNVTSEHGVGFGDARARRRLLSDPAREIVERWSVPGPVLLYRRHAVREMGGYSEDLRLEDWDLYLRLASRNAISYMDRVVAEYRWHGENTVASPEHASALADELSTVAWRSLRLFRGHLQLELIHGGAALAARSAWLRGRWGRWAVWRAAAILLKLVALAVPRRTSDQPFAKANQ